MWCNGKPYIIVTSPGPSNPKTIHLVFPASPLNTLNLGVRVKTGWLQIRIMCAIKSDLS